MIKEPHLKGKQHHDSEVSLVYIVVGLISKVTYEDFIKTFKVA